MNTSQIIQHLVTKDSDIKVCDDVVLADSPLVEKGYNSTNGLDGTASIKGLRSFSCIMSGLTGKNKLKMGNAPTSFEDEWNKARTMGMTTLLISGATIEDNSLILPTKNTRPKNNIRKWQFLPGMHKPKFVESRRNQAIAENEQSLTSTSHLHEISEESLKNLVFNEDSTLILSLSHAGDVLAISGVAGDLESGETSFEHYFKVYIFKKNPETGIFNLVGSPIMNTVVSYFKDDARADVSLSGDGKRLAIAVVHTVKRDAFESHEEGSGFVKIYTHDLADTSQDYAYLKTIYEGNAGGGGFDIGLFVSLDYDGSKLVVGEQYHDAAATADSSHDSGMVRVFDVDANTQIGSNIMGEEGGDYVGSSVMISKNGNCIIVGATGASESVASGLAYIYCLTEDGDEWVIRDTLAGEAAGDEFGHSVAITSDAEYVAVSAISNDVGGDKVDAGHVRVYSYDGSGYVQLGSDIDGSEGRFWTGRYYAGDLSGFDIAMSDVNEEGIINIVIGSPNNQDGGYYFGEVSNVFHFDDCMLCTSSEYFL